MELKKQLLIYLIAFLAVMFIIGLATSFLINFILYIGLFYLASELFLKNSQAQIITFSALFIYGIYALIQFSQNETYLDYYTFKSDLYQNFINTIINNARFNTNSEYLFNVNSYKNEYTMENDHHYMEKIFSRT